MAATNSDADNINSQKRAGGGHEIFATELLNEGVVFRTQILCLNLFPSQVRGTDETVRAKRQRASQGSGSGKKRRLPQHRGVGRDIGVQQVS